MNEIKELRKTYEEITREKSCQGAKARLAELDDAATIVLGEYELIPSFPRLRGYMKAVLSNKPNWGNKELMKRFDGAVTVIYG